MPRTVQQEANARPGKFINSPVIFQAWVEGWTVGRSLIIKVQGLTKHGPPCGRQVRESESPRTLHRNRNVMRVTY